MMKKINLLFCVLLATLFGYSQDILYTTSGNKISGKVTEINITDIKYKNVSNIDGPNYVISKNDVILIAYANGQTEIINSNPPVLIPKTETQEFKPVVRKQEEKKPLNLYYLNTNLLSINALALANGDVTILYDKELSNNKLSLSFLVGYNFNSRMGGLNAFIADSKDKAKKNFDVGLGFNFIPNNEKRVQYFIGILTKYMSYNYKETQYNNSNTQSTIVSRQGNQFAVMLSNGWIYRISPVFNFKVFASVGIPFNSPSLKLDYTGVPKVYLGYCFGYRF